MSLDPLALVAMLALVLVAAFVLWWLYRSRRTSALREREKRVSDLELRPLTPDERERLSGDWHSAKARFVDDPAAAIGDADRVIGQVMGARGYPVDDFDARYESLTVDHGEVARHYRAGHDIADRAVTGQATTEDLRQAMIHYEALFGELVSESEPAGREREREREPVPT